MFPPNALEQTWLRVQAAVRLGMLFAHLAAGLVAVVASPKVAAARTETWGVVVATVLRRVSSWSHRGEAVDHD
jgi:hypothetical protein